ncbi:MAG: cation:proton antiporter [Candidatus Bathyarchaeia archaeon]
MKTLLTIVILIFILTLPFINALEEEGIIYGSVYTLVNDERTPINALISIYENNTLIKKSYVESDGTYNIKLKPGTYTLKIEKKGYISKQAFIILKPNLKLEVNFELEEYKNPYEVTLFIKGLSLNNYPEINIDGLFQGYALNKTVYLFKDGSAHVLSLSEITEENERYIIKDDPLVKINSSKTIQFNYTKQFYVYSFSFPNLTGWYDENSIITLEAVKTIEFLNETRLVFNYWILNEKIINENPIVIKVNSSLKLDANYERQYLLQVYSSKAEAYGGGWYKEGCEAKVSLSKLEVDELAFKYKFKGWKGDVESVNSTLTLLMDSPKKLYAEWEAKAPIEANVNPIYTAIISISILICVARFLSGIFIKLKIPEVLGELFAGIILSPYAFGGLKIAGIQLIELNEYVLAFAEIGAILLLFIAGLEVSFAQFKATGFESAIIGALGVVIPFFTGTYVTLILGFSWHSSLIVGATLTATSIAITMKALEEIGKLTSIEGNLMINSAVIDDVLGLIVLTIVISIVSSGTVPSILNLILILLKAILFWFLLMMIVVFIAPRFISIAARWEAKGTVEAVSTAICFGSAVSAASIGLSPIVGSYAAGMALAESHVIAKIKDYIDKLSMIFAPIFFAVIGAQFNIKALTINSIFITLILLAIAVLSKLIGCGLPAIALLKNSRQGLRVGLGMVSRGEVGLIIAGIGITSGLITQDLYAAIITTVILTTIITPITLKRSYS